MKRKYKHDSTFNDTNPRAGNKREIVKLTDHVDVFKFKNSKYVSVRLVGPVFKQAVHWIRIKTKEGKEIGIPKKCFRYDADSDSFDTTKECPYCDKLHKEYSARQRYYTNAIIRQIEEDAPSNFAKKYSKTETKSGFKDGLDSKAWTPVRVLDLPAGVAGKIKGLADLNKHKVDGKSKAMPLSDEQYGRDIEIKYDKDAAAAQAYDVQKGDASPLDEDQQNYLHWDLEGTLEKIAESLEEDLKSAKEEVKRLRVVKKKDDDEGGDEYSDEGSDDGKGKGKGKKKAKPAAKKKSKKEESDDEDDESSDAVESSDDDEASDESSDAESSDESSDEDSDEKPAKKKAGKKPSKKEASDDDESSDDESSDSDDEDSDFNLDESSDDAEEDSDEKPAKKKSAGKKSKKEESDDDESSDDESSDDEGSDDDEESDEKPTKKSSKSSKSSSKKSSGKSSSKKKKSEDSDDESSF